MLTTPAPTIDQLFQMPPATLAERIAQSADGLQVATRLVSDVITHHRAELTERFIAIYGSRVAGGAFDGMQLPTEVAWGDGDRLAKLLGSYEAELHPALEETFASDHALVINIGCAEGYYAVGAAVRQRRAVVHAFDISEHARRICAAAAALNDVSDRVCVQGEATASEIAGLLASRRRAFVIVDCEGEEAELLQPDLLPCLAQSDLIIECHDFFRPGSTDELRQRFAPTHRIDLIREGARLPVVHPFLDELSGLERAIAMCEFRPKIMTWLFCTSLSALAARGGRTHR